MLELDLLARRLDHAELRVVILSLLLSHGRLGGPLWTRGLQVRRAERDRVREDCFELLQPCRGHLALEHALEQLLRDCLRSLLLQLLLRRLQQRFLLKLRASLASVLAEAGVLGLAADASVREVPPVDQGRALGSRQP